ncbi:MAG: hypothetical protein ACK4ND_05835 [Cytophagaceae bacterium]
MKNLAQEYLPKNENDLHNWLKNFASNLESFGTKFDITPSEISSLNVLIRSVKKDIQNGKSQESDKIEKKQDVLKFVNRYVEKIISHPQYNVEHGKNLGII